MNIADLGLATSGLDPMLIKMLEQADEDDAEVIEEVMAQQRLINAAREFVEYDPR